RMLRPRGIGRESQTVFHLFDSTASAEFPDPPRRSPQFCILDERALAPRTFSRKCVSGGASRRNGVIRFSRLVAEQRGAMRLDEIRRIPNVGIPGARLSAL